MQKGNDEMRQLANNIADYVWEKHIKPKMARAVRFYRAKVTSQFSNGEIGVTTPLSGTIFLPCVGSAQSLSVGQQCIVFEFGSSSNAIVIGDASLSNL